MGFDALLALPMMLINAQAGGEEVAGKLREKRENDQLAAIAGRDAMARGSRESSLVRTRGTQLIESQRVGYAASGVDAGQGTPTDVAAQTRYFSELDAKTVDNNAAREAWGFKNYGLKYGEQSDREISRINNRTAATILGGVGKLGSAAMRASAQSDASDFGEGEDF